MITSVAFCPATPLLLPGVTGGPVPEVEAVRDACRVAVEDLLAPGPSAVVIVGAAGRGTPVARYAPRPGTPRPDAPRSLALGVGLTLLGSANVPVEPVAIDPDATPAECVALGSALAARAGRLAVLVIGDGSARRPGGSAAWPDERAAGFDTAAHRALVTADRPALLALDPCLAGELLVSGRAAWQAAAGLGPDGTFRGTAYYGHDPFGVWYSVVSWVPAGAPGRKDDMA